MTSKATPVAMSSVGWKCHGNNVQLGFISLYIISFHFQPVHCSLLLYKIPNAQCHPCIWTAWHSISTGHVHQLTTHVVFVYIHFTRCTLACECAYTYCICGYILSWWCRPLVLIYDWGCSPHKNLA